MSEFDEAVARERIRLQELIAEAEGKIGELNAEVSLHKRRIEALDAYDRIKTGKPAGKAAGKKSARQGRASAGAAADEPETGDT